MKPSLPVFILVMAISTAFALAACHKDDSDQDVKKKSSISKEKTEEEVKY